MKEIETISSQGAVFVFVSELLEQIVMQLMTQQRLEESGFAVRVVGEFSSGKTRVIRELFKEYIPEPLLPISSDDVQTRLPLEVTFAEQVNLSLVKGTFGDKNRVIEKKFTYFPRREELTQYAQEEYSLHLTLPQKKFILPQGDGFFAQNQPARFYLIDTLGWNSEDAVNLDSEKYFSEDLYNLALIYVVKAVRVDSQCNREMITNIIKAFESGGLTPMLKQTLPVICIITACAEKEKDSHKMRMQKIFDTFMDECGIDKEIYPIHIITVEFDSMSVEEKHFFCDTVWEAILSDSPTQVSAESAITCALKNWPEEWDLQSYVKKSLVEYQSFMQALTCATHDGKYIKNMTRRRLDGLSLPAMREHLLKKWLRQLNCEDIQKFLIVQEVMLPKEHPVCPWWEQYWLPRREAMLQSQKSFFENMYNAIMTFTEDVQDLNIYFAKHVSKSFYHARIATYSAFGQLCQLVLEWEDSQDMEKFLSTLFSLSLMEAYYTDSVHQA